MPILAAHGPDRAATRKRARSPLVSYSLPWEASSAVLRSGGGLRNVDRRYWGRFIATKLFGIVNSSLVLIQSHRFGAQIEAVEPMAPVIILGHMRSGTTLLQELLALDRRLKVPNVRECLMPGHCLVSSRVVKGVFARFMSEARPQDNMEGGLQSPGEEEFALLSMGLPSPYRQVAFPNNLPIDANYLDFNGVSEADRRRWQEGLRWFVKVMSVRRPGRRVVLKSPLHLGRVRILLEAFPGASFIHIVRDPRRVFPSTLNMHRIFYRTQGFQTPTYAGLEEMILSRFERMYGQFERDRPRIPPGRLHELRYEDLVADPERELRALYRGLRLGDFEPVMQTLRDYLEDKKSYRTGTFELDAAMEAEINTRWGPWLRPYGYCGAGSAAQAVGR